MAFAVGPWIAASPWEASTLGETTACDNVTAIVVSSRFDNRQPSDPKSALRVIPLPVSGDGGGTAN